MVQQFRSRINWPTCGGHAWKDGGDMSLVWFSMLKAIRPKYTAAIHISTHRYVGLNLPAYIFLYVVWDCVSETRGRGGCVGECNGALDVFIMLCDVGGPGRGVKQVLTRLSTSPQPCQHRE